MMEKNSITTCSVFWSKLFFLFFHYSHMNDVNGVLCWGHISTLVGYGGEGGRGRVKKHLIRNCFNSAEKCRKYSTEGKKTNQKTFNEFVNSQSIPIGSRQRRLHKYSKGLILHSKTRLTDRIVFLKHCTRLIPIQMF